MLGEEAGDDLLAVWLYGSRARGRRPHAESDVDLLVIARTLFSKVFVATGGFDQDLSALARQAKEAREKGDYEAAPPSAREAAEFVEGAADFLAAIEALLAGEDSETAN